MPKMYGRQLEAFKIIFENSSYNMKNVISLKVVIFTKRLFRKECFSQFFHCSSPIFTEYVLFPLCISFVFCFLFIHSRPD
jgi:hypothetical protein